MWKSPSLEEFCNFHPLLVFLGCVNPDESLGSQFLYVSRVRICIHSNLGGNGFVAMKATLRESGLNYV